MTNRSQCEWQQKYALVNMGGFRMHGGSCLPRHFSLINRQLPNAVMLFHLPEITKYTYFNVMSHESSGAVPSNPYLDGQRHPVILIFHFVPTLKILASRTLHPPLLACRLPCPPILSIPRLAHVRVMEYQLSRQRHDLQTMRMIPTDNVSRRS